MRILRIVSLMIRELITSRELTYKILANILFMRVLGNRELNYQEVKIRSSSVAVFDISIETDPLRITTSCLKGLADELV